jgi:hypothetical protein
MRTREQGVIPFQTFDDWKKNYGKSNKTPEKVQISADKRTGLNLTNSKAYSEYIKKAYGASPKDISTITPEMIEASRIYTNISYSTMNGYLRGNETALSIYEMNPKDAKYEIKQIKELNSYINKNSMKDPVTLYRGITGKYTDGLKVGDEYLEKSFGSFSTIEDIASGFSGTKDRTMFRVVTKKGDEFAPALRGADGFNDKEGEFISAINSKYKIINITQKDKVKYIDMELIK